MLRMKTRLPVMIVVVACLILSFATGASLAAQPTAATSPDTLVANLYKAHNQKRSPFFQTRSRARLDAYFVKSLGDLIWNDAKNSKGEVGVIDGDPLYDAQDMEIKNFMIGKPAYEGRAAKVVVTFSNFGQKKTIIYRLVKLNAGWRIDDIDYGEGRTLRSEFKSGT